MLQIELEFWGIDEKIFKQKNQIEMIQEIFDKPIYEIFDQNDSSQFFNVNMNKRARLDFPKLIADNKLKFDKEFRIRNIKELAEVEFGENYSKKSLIGRVYLSNNSFYEGELVLSQYGTHQIDGFGRYIDGERLDQGNFMNHNLHG